MFCRSPCTNLTAVKTARFPAVRCGSVAVARATIRSPMQPATISWALSKADIRCWRKREPTTQPPKIAVVVIVRVSSVNPGRAGSAAILWSMKMGSKIQAADKEWMQRPTPTKARTWEDQTWSNQVQSEQSEIEIHSKHTGWSSNTSSKSNLQELKDVKSQHENGFNSVSTLHGTEHTYSMDTTGQGSPNSWPCLEVQSPP